MSRDAEFQPRLAGAPHDAGLGVHRALRPVDSGGPALRLVDEDGRREAPSTRAAATRAAMRERHRAIERENHAASRLDPDDARGIVAARVAEALEGGPAAILRPERRRRIVALASRLGLRPFDANLIIAIVQDGARRGAAAHDPETHGRLRLIDTPIPRRTSISPRPQRGGGPRSESGWPTIERWVLLARAVAATLLAVFIASALIAWVIGLF